MRFALVLIGCLIFGSVAALAADVPKETVEKMSKLAHELLPQATYNGKDLIGEEKAKELQYPLVSYEIREATIIRGHVSGFAHHCDMDWAGKSFEPFMSMMRQPKYKLNEYQIAYIGMLHGVAMGAADRFSKDKECTDTVKDGIRKNMAP